MLKIITTLVLTAGLLTPTRIEPAKPLPPPAPVIEKPARPREVWVEEEVASAPSIRSLRMRRQCGEPYREREVASFELHGVIVRRPDFMRKAAR
jgi:hypothetical protein